jgi:hypothetical protein
VEFRETLEIFSRHVLRVLNGETLVMIAVFLFDIGENIEHHRNRAVADRMNAQL